MKNSGAIQAFVALGQESRLNIFRLIVQRGDIGLTPTQIIEKLGIPNATLSFHLKELVQASLLVVERQSRNLIYRPNVALVTDVCHDTATPMVDKIENGDQKSGDGPVLTYGPAVQNNFLKLIIKAAEKNKIPFQRAAVSRSTGTDTDAFAYSNEGVTSALISLPLRYMHTTVETVQKEDVENCIRLIFETLKTIKNGQDFRYLK